MQKNSEGLYRRLLMVLFGAALLHLFDSLSLEARGQEVRTFQPGQVDCSSPPLSTPPNIDVVQVPTGVQTVDESGTGSHSSTAAGRSIPLGTFISDR
jgi:hypothetical protein